MLELLAQSKQAFAAAGCKEAKVTHLDEAFRQHMLQEAVDEFFGGECAQLELAGVRGTVAKGHLVVFQLDQAAVADGYPENIGGQVFQGCAPIAHRFAVHHPILLPDLAWNCVKEGCL